MRFHRSGSRRGAELLRAFAEAFESLAPAMRSSAPGAQARLESGDDDAAVVSWACEHLAGLETTVVVDDLDAVAAAPRNVAFLRGLIDATIPRLRWILIGRDAAAFPVARWLADSVAELPIDDDDLRIGLDELRAAVASAGLAFDDDELTALHRATLGRPLRLAVALTIGHADEAESADQLYAGLVDAALAASDEAARERWYEAALLARFDVPLLHALGHDAATTTAELTAAGFVYATAGGAYAFDEPFRAALLARADALAPARRDALLARTAAALEANGRWSDAVALHLRGHDPERLASSLDARGSSRWTKARSPWCATRSLRSRRRLPHAIP